MSELIQKHLKSGVLDPELLIRIQWEYGNPTPGGRYRHWHKLRYLEPPKGLTSELWWLAIKMARSTLLKPLPLLDREGRPFQFAVPDLLFEMLHQIDRKASGAIEADQFPNNNRSNRRFLLGSLEEEAIRSSQLEGAATTRKVAKGILREKRAPRNRSEQMILNNHRGMRFIRGLEQDRPLDPELVFQLHRILTEETLADPSASGRFRQTDEDIAVMDENDRILHDPPPASTLPDRLQAMCVFANDVSAHPFIHPVIRSILLHFWLAYDHPFVDGNGRTARALFYWSMARHGYWLIEYTSISRLLLRTRSRYNRAFLYSESDENDTTYFVLHQCNTILQAIQELHEYIGRKMADARRSRDLLHSSVASEFNLNFRQLALLRYAIDHPETQFTFKTHQRYHNVSYQTANADLQLLTKRELLVRHKAGREFVFIAPDDLHQRLEG